jgi:hypothetical protein
MHHEVQELRDIGFKRVALGLRLLKVRHGRCCPRQTECAEDGSTRQNFKALEEPRPQPAKAPEAEL